MVISGRSVIKDYEQPANNIIENLDERFSLLVDMYKNTVSRYAELCSEYICLKKSCNSRRKSFPQMEQWIPTGGLQDGDLELLKGPTNVSVYKQIITEDINTGRQVSYSACDNDSFDFEAQYSCCFVQLPSDSTPAFGRISLFLTYLCQQY